MTLCRLGGARWLKSTASIFLISRCFFFNPHRRGKLFASSALSLAIPHSLQSTETLREEATCCRTVEDEKELSPDILLGSIKAALSKKNILTAYGQYCSLEKSNHLDLLGGPDIEYLDKHLSFLLNDFDIGRMTSAMTSTIENFSLSLASRGFEEGLRAVMVLHIKKKDSSGALRLYNDYLNIVHPSKEGSSSRFGRSHVRSEVTALAITAHASFDSWDKALRLAMSQPTRFTTFTIRDLHKILEFDKDLQVKTISYLHDLNVVRLVLSLESFNRHVLNLTKDNATSQFQSLCKILIRSLRGPRAWLAKDEKSLTASQPLCLPERAWGWVLTACLTLRLDSLAEELWVQLLAVGVPLGVVAWTALLDGYRNAGSVDGVIRSWDAMIANGIKPDSFAYRAIISAFFYVHRKDQAISVFISYQNECPRDQQSPTIYNSIIHGLLIHSDIFQARAIFNDMLSKGPLPDIVTYNSFLRFYGRKGDLKAIAIITKTLSERGLTPDIVTYTTIISALLKKGKKNAVHDFLALMKSAGLKENVATYSAIIDQQVRENSETGLRTAWDLLAKMEQLPSAQPNEVTYTTLIAGIHRNREIGHQQVVIMLNDVTSRMARRGVRPNRVTYNILLKACLDNPRPIGLKCAMTYYREMQDRNIMMSVDTWFILLKGLVHREEWGLANELVGHLVGSGFQPPSRIKELITQIRANA